MDGYAVRAEDLPGPLPVAFELPAGSPVRGIADRASVRGSLPVRRFPMAAPIVLFLKKTKLASWTA